MTPAARLCGGTVCHNIYFELSKALVLFAYFMDLICKIR